MAIVADASGNNPTDKSWDKPNRTNTGSPQSSLTPQYAGELVLDTTNGALYEAVTPLSNSWIRLA